MSSVTNDEIIPLQVVGEEEVIVSDHPQVPPERQNVKKKVKTKLKRKRFSVDYLLPVKIVFGSSELGTINVCQPLSSEGGRGIKL